MDPFDSALHLLDPSSLADLRARSGLAPDTPLTPHHCDLADVLAYLDRPQLSQLAHDLGLHPLPTTRPALLRALHPHPPRLRWHPHPSPPDPTPATLQERWGPRTLHTAEGQGDTLTCDPHAQPAWRHRLILADNRAALAQLTAEGLRADLVYMDPPFASGTDRRVIVRADGETLPAYADRFDDLGDYLDTLHPLLRALHTILHPRGSTYVHLDPTAAHYVKVLLDQVFGRQSFQREIVWRIGWVSGYKSKVRNWVRNHDTLLFYVRTPGDFVFHKTYAPYPPGYTRRKGSAGRGVPLDDVWNANAAEHALTGPDSLDSIQLKSFSEEKTGYPTQKNLSLLRRIVHASSDPDALVLDPYAGSGTTLAAADALGRRWIGCDHGAPAVHTARRRLLRDTSSPFDLWWSAPPPPWRGPRLRLTRTPDGLRIRLDAPDVDLWAVSLDPRDPFTPSWASLRRLRRRRKVWDAPRSVTLPCPPGHTIRIRAYDAGGRLYDTTREAP